MNRQLGPAITVTLAAVAILILGGLVWANYRYAERNRAGDHFLPLYSGTRLFLETGADPYTRGAARAAQEMAYGRRARGDESPQQFLYPFYSILVFAPFTLFDDYLMARALWMTMLEMALFLLVALSINLSKWRLSTPMLALLLVFAVLWFHSVRPILNGDPAVLVALLIAGGCWALRAGNEPLAGFLFGMGLIKPQMVLLLLVFVLIWAVSTRRWVLFWSVLATGFFLWAVATLLRPDWIMQNLRQVMAFREVRPPSTPGAIFRIVIPGIGAQLGWTLTVFTLGMLFWEWKEARRRDFRWFYWTVGLTLALTNLAGIHTATENYVALLPGIVLVLAVWDERWGALGRGLAVTSMLGLLLGLWTLFFFTLRPGDPLFQHPVMFLPAPIMVVIGLYWARWTVIRPPGPLMDQLRRDPLGPGL
jgi:hypothetical protein